MPTPVRGTVRLVNAVFYAHHGVLEEEHRIGGRYEVDVAMELDVAAAAATDELDTTVDYEGVYNVVKAVVTGAKRYLIERVAVEIAQAVMAKFEMVDAVAVTVRKPNPPVGGPCDRAEVTVRLSRA